MFKRVLLALLLLTAAVTAQAQTNAPDSRPHVGSLTVNRLNVPGALFLGSTALTGNTLVGVGAGVNLGPGEHLVTATGWHALYANILNGNAEATAYGWNAGGVCTNCSQLAIFGINVLGSCTIGCVHDILFGTDSCRNCNNANSYLVGIGVTTLINTKDSNVIAIGDSAYVGNSSQPGGAASVIAIGFESANGASTMVSPTQSVFIGDFTAVSLVSPFGTTIVGHQGGQNIVSALTDSGFGWKTLFNDIGNGINTAFGEQSCAGVTTGNFVLCLGAEAGALRPSTGNNVILVGYQINAPAGGTSNYMSLADVIQVTGINTPSTSNTHIAGTFDIGGTNVVPKPLNAAMSQQMMFADGGI